MELEHHYRDCKTLAESLNSEKVQNKIVSFMAEKELKEIECSKEVKQGIKEVVEKEVWKYLPKILKNAHIFDISDISYWLYMLSFLLGYVLIEVFLFTFFEADKSFSLILIAFIGLTSIALGYYIYKLYSKSDKIRTSPIIALAFGLMSIQLFFVLRTDYNYSPLIPTLFYTSLFLISVPRENSLMIYFIFLFAIIVCIVPFVCNCFYIRIYDLPKSLSYLNLITFIYGGSTTMVLRSRKSQRISR